MIRVSSIEDIPQPARDRIKAKVMRRFIAHLQERPEISDGTLRTALGFDRETLEAMYADLDARTRTEQSAQAGQGRAQAQAARPFSGALVAGHEPASTPRPAPLVAGIVAGQEPMARSLGHAANGSAPITETLGREAGARRETGCCGAPATQRD